jgi:hypothetical protein
MRCLIIRRHPCVGKDLPTTQVSSNNKLRDPRLREEDGEGSRGRR